MIKVTHKRYNLDEIWTYYPAYVVDNPCIRIETKHGKEVDIVFKTEEERSQNLKAMDELMLLIEDGVVLAKGSMDGLPFIVQGDDFNPSGGINMQ